MPVTNLIGKQREVENVEQRVPIEGIRVALLPVLIS
jgi:hypothetical protein